MIKVFQTLAEYTAFTANQDMRSGDIAYIVADKSAHFHTNNIDGVDKVYNMTFGDIVEIKPASSSDSGSTGGNLKTVTVTYDLLDLALTGTYKLRLIVPEEADGDLSISASCVDYSGGYQGSFPSGQTEATLSSKLPLFMLSLYACTEGKTYEIQYEEADGGGNHYTCAETGTIPVEHGIGMTGYKSITITNNTEYDRYDRFFIRACNASEKYMDLDIIAQTSSSNTLAANGGSITLTIPDDAVYDEVYVDITWDGGSPSAPIEGYTYTLNK